MKLKIAIMLATILSSGNALSAPYIQDSGKIVNLYVSTSGNIAIQLNNGFPNAKADGQCATASVNAFGGNLTADPAFKSALLAAKAAQQNITVTVQGCEASGAWFKIIDVYVGN